MNETQRERMSKKLKEQRLDLNGRFIGFCKSIEFMVNKDLNNTNLKFRLFIADENNEEETFWLEFGVKNDFRTVIGGKYYIQHRLDEFAAEVFSKAIEVY